MKNECVRRLNILKLNCVDEFLKDQVLISDGGNLRKPDIDELGIIDDLQEKHGMMIYHLIKDEFGLSALYVSAYKEDWEFETPQPNGFRFYVEAFCYNETDCYLSEFGSIVVEIENGTLKRVG